MSTFTFIALKCSDIDKCRAFYELAGLTFGPRHRHGKGPEHVACEMADGLIFELYPKRKSDSPDQTAIGISVPDLAQAQAGLRNAEFACAESEVVDENASFVVRDPDGRRVEVRALKGIIKEEPISIISPYNGSASI